MKSPWRGRQSKFCAVLAELGSARMKSVPVFQQLAEGHWSGRDDDLTVGARPLFELAGRPESGYCSRTGQGSLLRYSATLLASI